MTKLQSTGAPPLSASDYRTFRFQVESIISRINTSIPVKVVAVRSGAAVGVVDVIPQVTQLSASGEPVAHTTIYNVPYARIQGGKNALIIDPKVGDLGVACFCSHDITAFKNAKKEAPPPSLRKFSKADAIYFGGILNGEPVRYVQVADEGITIVADNSVTINAPNVTVNSDASTVNTKTSTVKAQNATVDAPNIALKAQNAVTLDTPMTNIAGGLTFTGTKGKGLVAGDLRVKNNIISEAGSITAQAGDVKARDISLIGHIHDGVISGEDKTGAAE